MSKLNKQLKKHLKFRIISSILDMLSFLFLCTVTFVILLNIVNVPMYWFLLYFFIFYFVYYAWIPKLLKGYTLIGIFFNMKIVKLDGSEISIWEYFKRSLYGIFSYLYFLGYMRVRSNLLGQFYFDKPFNITVVSNYSEINDTVKDNKDISFYFLGE